MARKAIKGWTVVLCMRKKKDFGIQRRGFFRIMFWKFTLTFYPFYQDNVVRNLQKDKKDLFLYISDLNQQIRSLQRQVETLTKDNSKSMEEGKTSEKEMEWVSTTATSVEMKILSPLNTLGQNVMSVEGTTVGAGMTMDVQSVDITTEQQQTKTLTLSKTESQPVATVGVVTFYTE